MQFAAPTPDHLAFFAEASNLSEQMANELTPGYSFTGSVSDLEMIQSIVNSGMLDAAADPLFLLRCLGVVFGNVLATSLPDLAWSSLTDEYGCDVGLRYRETTIIVFPVTMLSKRAEDGREIEPRHLHDWLVEHVQTMVASGEYQ